MPPIFGNYALSSWTVILLSLTPLPASRPHSITFSLDGSVIPGTQCSLAQGVDTGPKIGQLGPLSPRNFEARVE